MIFSRYSFPVFLFARERSLSICKGFLGGVFVSSFKTKAYLPNSNVKLNLCIICCKKVGYCFTVFKPSHALSQYDHISITKLGARNRALLLCCCKLH